MRVSFIAGLVGALAISDYGQVFAVAIVVASAWFVARSRTMKQDNEALRGLLETGREEMKGCIARADKAEQEHRNCEQLVAHLQGELKTMERYTAQGALEQVAKEIGGLGSGIASLGNLVTENMGLLVQLRDTQGRLAEVLERLADKPDA